MKKSAVKGLKKCFIINILLFLATATTWGQDQYNNLRILYADGNYEKLVRNAEKLTASDKTKKEVMPYVWMAKGLYKIHLKGDASETYKNAYKDAINAISKALKFDKTGEVMGEDSNAEFLNEFQGSLVEQIENEILEGNYRKAFSWVNSYKKISKNLIGQMLLDGVCKFHTDDRSSAFSMWKKVSTLLKDTQSIDMWTEADIKMLRLGAMQTAECYVKIKKVEDAKNTLNLVAHWFEDNDDFQQTYKDIVN